MMRLRLGNGLARTAEEGPRTVEARVGADYCKAFVARDHPADERWKDEM